MKILRLCLLLVLVNVGLAQSVYERGTFTSLPAGKHINHSYYGTWNTFFAVEDGVLVYDHQLDKWLEPITASNGLNQYPALLVWEDQGTKDIWIVTPDYVFVYDPLTDWMSRQSLPLDPKFSGKYELGITSDRVVIRSIQTDESESYSAIFFKHSGTFETWGADSTLDIDWDTIDIKRAIPPEFEDIHETLGTQTVINGNFDADGLLHLDGYPMQSASAVSALSGANGIGEVFLSTYGMGVFHQDIRGAQFQSLPFGLLSPDVMCLEDGGEQIIVGGRAGLTFLKDFDANYDEALTDPVLDYSFISAIDTKAKDILIAGRGGVFQKDKTGSGWDRIISKKDLESSRIYSIAYGNDGYLMIGTERNAYLYHESGLILQTLFPDGLDWPVFDIEYADGRFYLSTYFGLYVYDEIESKLVLRLNSYGAVQKPQAAPAIDPIYESEVSGRFVWASTHRGLVKMDVVKGDGTAYIAPQLPFKPRGLSMLEGRLWVGSHVGLYSFDSDQATWRLYNRKDGLISNFVTDLVAKDNYIWLGTNIGLTRIKWRNLY